MLKVLVFDGGCGGEAVADYLAEELKVVEVIRVIEYKSKVYEKKPQLELGRLVERSIKGYIGKVDLIVLGGYTVSLALNYLSEKYKYQKFVGVSVNYYRILKATSYPLRITVIMNETLLNSSLCEELKDRLAFSTLAIPDCNGWGDLAKEGKLSSAIMQLDLGDYFELHPTKRVKLPKQTPKSILETVAREKYQPQNIEESTNDINQPKRKLIRSDTVLILNTCLWNLKREIEDVFGYRVRVLDFREKLLHDVCSSLKLLGVHGGRSK